MAICTHLKWAEEPAIRPCAIGEPADFQGWKIIAVYNDGREVPVDVTLKMFHEPDLQKTGTERQGRIVYDKQKIIVPIPLNGLTLQKMEAIPKEPLTFHKGEIFDRTRIVVTAYYSDGSSREVQNYKIYPYGVLTPENKTLTIRYGCSSCTIPLTVLPQDALSPSTGTTDFSTDSQASSHKTTEGASSESTTLSFPLSPAPEPSIPAGPDFSVPVSAEGASGWENSPIPTRIESPGLIQPRTVKKVVAISVARKPNHQKYLAGDTAVDLKGGRLDIIYSDGTVGQIDMMADDTVYIDSRKPGIGSVSFTCLGTPVSFPVDILEPEITRLTVAKMPAKTDYVEGEILDLSGLVLEAVYNDGSIRTVRGLQSNGLKVSRGHTEEGVTLSYEGKPFTVKIHVRKKDIPARALSMELTQKPDKTRYIENEPGGIHLSGAVLLVQMSDGRRERVPVTRDMVEPVDLSQPGRCLLTIRYMGLSVNCPLFVQPKTICGMALRSGPKKVEYVEGENVDVRGVVVEVCYDNGERIPISDYEVVPETVSLSDKTVIFRYHGMETSVPVSVQPLRAMVLDWVRQPEKTVYYTKEKNFSCDGGILRVKRNDGTEEEVALTPGMVEGFRTDQAGPLPLRVSYAGKVIPFSVMVKERVLLGLQVIHPPRLEYTEGEELDPEGLVVEALYSGATSETVNVTYLPYGPLKTETSSMMFVYQDKAVLLPITVSKQGISEVLSAPPASGEHKTNSTSAPVQQNLSPVLEAPTPDPPYGFLPGAISEKCASKGKLESVVENPLETETSVNSLAEEGQILPKEQKRKRKSSIPAFYPSSFVMRFSDDGGVSG